MTSIKIKTWLLFLFITGTAIGLNAQSSRVRRLREERNNVWQNIVKKYADSLTVLKTRYDSIPAESGYPENPYLHRILLHPTLYNAPLRYTMQSNWQVSDSVITDKGAGSQWEFHNDSLIALSNRTLMYAYSHYPELISTTEQDLQEQGGIRSDVIKEIKQNASIAQKRETVDWGVKDEDLQVVVYRPNFWKFSGNYSLQLMQNYVSDNWYKGGENNHSFLASIVLNANYNNKQKVQFENKLEMKLGFQYYKNDKAHKYRTTSDQLRLTNKLGLQAIGHWNYTLQLQSWTQFHPGYKNNNKKVYSDFMSPFETVLSLGMEYKLNVKNFTLSVNLSPFAYDLKYVDRKNLATSFGVDKGKHSKFTYGSTMTTNFKWNVIKNVTWNGRIYYFSNYENVQVDWENTINLTINKYLSSKLFLQPRFDDGYKKSKDSYLQFKEYLSLGLNLTF